MDTPIHTPKNTPHNALQNTPIGNLNNAPKNGLNQSVQSDAGAVCSLEYFCEMCEYYPLQPVHGHYECPQCGYKTKCCEGAPQD